MKNSRQAGNRSENLVCAMLDAEWATFPARGSRGPVDIVAFPLKDPYLPALAIQVGTGAKPVAKTLQELLEAPRPIGSLAIVARKTKQKNGRIKWLFHSPHGKFLTLLDAISAKEEV